MEFAEYVFERNGHLIGKIRVESGMVWFDYVKPNMSEEEFDYFTDKVTQLDELHDFYDEVAVTSL